MLQISEPITTLTGSFCAIIAFTLRASRAYPVSANTISRNALDPRYGSGFFSEVLPGMMM